MKATARPNLFKYLRQRGISTDPQARACIMGEISDGKLKAYVAFNSEPAPIHSGLAAMVKYFESSASEPRHVLATSVPEVRLEIEKAAMVMDADWNILNRLLVDVPVESAKERHIYKKPKHLELILDTLRAEGFDPKALPPYINGMATQKALVREILVERKKVLSKSQFNHGWDFGKESKEIDFVLN